METTKIRGYAEIGSYVAVVLVAVVVLSTFVAKFIKTRQEPLLVRGLQKGQSLDTLSPYLTHNGNETLLIAMNTYCEFCKEGTPFFNELQEQSQRPRSTTNLLAVFPNREDQVAEYVAKQHLSVKTASGVDLNALSVRGTPTLILVDSTGRIVDFWIGKLSQSDQLRVREVAHLGAF